MECKCETTELKGSSPLNQDAYGALQKIELYACNQCEAVTYKLMTLRDERWVQHLSNPLGSLTKTKLENLVRIQGRDTIELASFLGAR